MNTLEALKSLTTVVADTGQFLQIAQFKPRDATTNPTLILKAVQEPAYRPLLDRTRQAGRSLDETVDRVLVNFGCAILEHVPGRVSTEVDARLSFDIEGSLQRARRLIALYEAEGVPRERILIKLASTWEGIQAARTLEREGIHCNLTLLFAFAQAQACADAQVTLISPFVGRILDWHKAKAGGAWHDAAHRGEHDPGVQSVRRIHAHYKSHGIRTEVMGASFRNVDQILALAGCDLLTISPDLLAQLQAMDVPVQEMPASGTASTSAAPIGETDFRFAFNEDAMASDKLAEGIRAFVADARRLDDLLN
jgi:transaldolase